MSQTVESIIRLLPNLLDVYTLGNIVGSGGGSNVYTI